MSHYRSRPIAYEEFVQRVRRYRPSDLLPVIAATACKYFDREAFLRDRVCLPWSLAAAAKASIVAGNEHRAAGVDEHDVREICSAYNALRGPLDDENPNPSGSVAAFLVRIGTEQFRDQESGFEEIARFGALFDDLDNVKTEVLTNTVVQDLLGYSVEEFVVAGFVLAVSAVHNIGRFDPDWPALHDGPKSIDARFPMATVRRVFTDLFLTDFDAVFLASERARQPDPLLRHLEFNPLTARPYVEMPNGEYLAPAPHLVFQRLAPSTLYYAGVEHFGDAFARDVGVVFERYVGQQLRLLTDAQVIPEISYDRGQRRGVDWIVIFDDLVLLVEAKSTRMRHIARIGGDNLADDLKRCLGRAFAQIDRTNHEIAEGNPAFAEIPRDRPRIGMVATLEPYWAANTPFVRDYLGEPAVPITVASARELEHAVDVLRVTGGGETLRAVLADSERRHWNLQNALPNVETPKNPILESAWNRYPFPDRE